MIDKLKPFNRTDALLLSVIGLIALASALPFAYAAHGQLPEAGDLIIHWPRMLAFDETLWSGIWLPRWLGSMNGGYGAATTLFYAPLLYYALSAAHAAAGSWPAAIEIVVALAALGSGVSMYVYMRALSSRSASLVAALLYVLSPYHLIDLYHRGALAELLAFVWMPLVMLAFTKTAERFQAPAVAGGALAFGMLVLTHPPTAYLFALAYISFIAFYAFQAKRRQPLINGLLILALGGALAAFYALPAVTEVQLIYQSVTDLFHQRMGFINELLTGNRFEQLVGVIAILMAVLLILFGWLARKQIADSDEALVRRRHFSAWIFAGALSLMLLLPLVKPLVRIMPGMSAVAFVWRGLGVAVLATSVLAGAAIDVLRLRSRQLTASADSQSRKTSAPRVAIAVTLLIIGILAFGIIAAARASNLRLAFVPPTTRFEQDFAPLGAPSVYGLPRDKTCEFVDPSPDSQARLIEWQPERRIIETDSPAGGTLHVYSFMYPGWTATLDGSYVPIEMHPQLKTMLINLPPGYQRLTLSFNDTRARTVAECISLVTLAIIVILLLPYRRRHSRPRNASG